MVEARQKDMFQKRALESINFQQYAVLDSSPSYLTIRVLKAARLIARARCEQLGLNARPWNRETEGARCAMCNLGEEETSFHFLCTCPIIVEFRRRYYGKPHLESWEISQSLEGDDWFRLYGFLKDALNYRNFLIENFNFVG